MSVLIAIDGVGATGKSTFAAALSRQLRIVERPRATIDVDDIADSLVDFGSEPAALRFRDALRLANEQLARYPHIGSLKKFPNDRLSGLRSWPIIGFPKQHGGRDLTQIS